MSWIFAILALFGILVISVPIIIVSIKRKQRREKIVVPVVQKSEPELVPEPTSVDMPHPEVMVRDPDHVLYEKFMKTYDSGNFEFNNVGFRKGAKITCPFGISNGFKYIKGKMEWGFVRLHTGVDRAGGAIYKNIPDIVQIPFYFDRSEIVDYGNTSYGSLIRLFNDEFHFEMRIAHMDPKLDIIPWSYERLLAGKSFEPDWLLGSAGNYGDSSGAHTHTEFLSQDDSCEVFDILLEEKYGDKALVEYTKAEILRLYRQQIHFKNSSDREILKDWEAVKAHRGATFVNKYKYKFQNQWGTKFTRYSSELLFNGL